MVSFLASIVITIVMTGIAVAVGKRRPVGTPLTWGEAFVAAVYVTTLMLVVYGIVPNQWLLWADNELAWRRDAFFFGPGSTFHKLVGITVTKEAVRDIIATVIYGIGLTVHVYLWLWWQKRDQPKSATPEVERSAFGRPLVRVPADAGGGG